MRRFTRLLLALLLCRAPSVAAQSLVADTPPLSPAEQLTKFHLPPGFEIQLVAHEPDVHKPMNMKFDAHGHLWVTHSLEYPFAAPSDETARDAITVFSDFGADGRARHIQRFAEKLNIPIGVLPLGDGEAIAWSIPNIYRLVDSDGDGLADKKEIVFGPFGVTDTHGDQNAFTRWVDGWIYANHGFSNDSRVKVGGRGADVLHMQSGNTYRFRPDGSAIEQYSYGQVNPFGLSFDPLGNLFSADCHSSAVSLLLREGYYQSFGKPHDGLGFAPAITHIDHGGTGIAGVAYGAPPDFPPEYRDVLFVGNVITNRVHCDRLKWIGSTPVVTKVEDFVTCDDPWFRPVDLQFGPDGALYVADFYNCIIGHYEVPLTHPKRDRERGRLWRVVYKGHEGQSPSATIPTVSDLYTLNAQQVFTLLGSQNLTVRVLATNYLVDKFPNEAAAMSRELLSQDVSLADADGTAQAGLHEQAGHAVWVLQRTLGVSEQIARYLMRSGMPATVQVHVIRALGESVDWRPWQFEVVRAATANVDPLVRRAAAESIARHPSVENLPPLLTLLAKADRQDALLHHQVRMSLRDQMRDPAVADRILDLALSDVQRAQLVDFAATAPTGASAVLVFEEALAGRVSNDVLATALPVAAKYVDASRVDAMIAHVLQTFPGNASQQFSALRALADGLSERGLPLTATLQTKLTEFCRSAMAGEVDVAWYNSPLPNAQSTPSPWVPQLRPRRDGGTDWMMSSLPERGERLGGVLHSPAFEIPSRLSFWMCGHNGLPNKLDRKLNFVRLILEDGAEVARSYPPRDDIAQRYDWDLRPHAGRRGRIEVVDGITDLDGFAWMAVSKFEPAAIALPDRPINDKGACRTDLMRLAAQYELRSLTDEIAAMAEASTEDLSMRLVATEALLALDARRAIGPLRTILADAETPLPVREQAAQQLGQIVHPGAREALVASLKSAPESLAVVVAASLAGNKQSAPALLEEIQRGRASATLLLEPTVVEPLKSAELANVGEIIDELTAGLLPADNRIAKLIADRRAAFLAGHADPDAGRQVYAKSVCASCHRIGDVGKAIGPALDGIGTRGLDRLLEDALDPSRNVDPAFRMTTIVTEDGRALSGFGLRDEGANLVLNNSNGEQVRVPLSDVEERLPSAVSPMPVNVIEQMPQEEFNALLAYLLSLRND